MESNDELKETNTCYCFDDLIKIEDFVFDDILIDKREYKNLLVYKIFCKTLIGAKPMRIRFDKINGFIRVCDGTRYLVLIGFQN